eukprot:TRINITY_DN1741_c0_g1_i1.p1 TRINITY_DN1741_c0_g1~~TRINITY_DN1741_c0_g1_i1.p1  ORF type:complete len:356 (-),score=91.20 TRINITY_DN1741_c0_g1_i1:78-1145(-)
MFAILGRKRIAWTRFLLILSGLFFVYWLSNRPILIHRVLQERRILAETTTPSPNVKDSGPDFDEEALDPSLSITAPTGDDLTEKPPPLSLGKGEGNNQSTSPLPEVYAKKLKDYFFEKEGHFFVPEASPSSGEVHFYLFGKDKESLDLHKSLFSNEHGVFISQSPFNCTSSNHSESQLRMLFQRNSIFKDIFTELKNLRSEYLPSICSLFKIKMTEVESLSSFQLNASDPLLFNFRDPRGRLKEIKEVKSLCASMQSDLKLISKLPQRLVIRLRFEDLFAKPRNEIDRLLKKLGLTPKDIEGVEKDLILPPEWELGGNSLNKINKWKTKLSLDDIKTIENECREVISRMEYHIVS